MSPRFTTTTWHNAGELRHYAASRFGYAYEAGACPAVMTRAMTAARRLARLRSEPLDLVIDILRADYCAAFA